MGDTLHPPMDSPESSGQGSWGTDSGQTKDPLSIVLCGEAGLGIQTIEYLLTQLLKREGYYVFATKEYMSRIRGGSNSSEIRVSSRRVAAYVDRIDLLIPLDQDAIPHLRKRISGGTTILGEREKVLTDLPLIHIPFSQIALEMGNIVFSNTVAVGVIAGLFQIQLATLNQLLHQHFSAKSEEILRKNLEAARRGYDIGVELNRSGQVRIRILRSPQVREEIFLNGSEAVALGAIAGGCNFISSYPMSPSTGVFTFLAQQSKEFGILVEQAEDEIGAINMGLGAWYAGARAMVSTSGGGFSLMTEATSLAGMIESPMVIHLAQRPGPATGLPTRTEQADLQLGLYAGHGEFPRILFAPGTLQDAFYLTQRAFNLSDQYQVPVLVLTDQFLMDSFYNVPPFDLSGVKIQRYIKETEEDYRRYRLTENGISERGIPGFGKGLVAVDSDEHDQEGHITEDLELRSQMVNKRLKKLESIRKEAIPPTLVGREDYRALLVGWGSTFHVIREALEELGREDVSFLHFSQVYPLPPR
ncbi:MAG: 2-oxoacid:acceptor oxidoreductase subunit alpha, partial [candidate division NC10 bacterium]|nr:2-oxoacid:acceptor oxidoreductase subunit alpha [candidate division NC10 bacterium]